MNEALEAAYKLPEIEKSALKNVTIYKVSWGPRNQYAFKVFLDALKNAVKLSFTNPRKYTCVFKDA